MASLSYRAVKIAHADWGFPGYGPAKFDDLKIIEAEPFDAFTVYPAGVAVYDLGNNGTARKLLKSWPVTTS
jgi:hypothetical protein